MNVKLLRKVAKHILAEPKRFVMGDWVKRKEDLGPTFNGDDNKEHRFAKCGTAACIAGWACILGENPNPERSYSSAASELLGIETWGGTHIGANLYFVDNWPYKFSGPYNAAKSQLTRAKIAAKRIEHFIKTGE